MKYSLLILAFIGFTANAYGTAIINYSWEDGGTVLAVYPEPELPSVIATNVAAKDGHPVHQSYDFGNGGSPFGPRYESSRFSLRLEQNDPDGVSAVYLAYVWGIDPHYNANVTATVWRYIESPSDSLSVRLWGHWCTGLPGHPYQYDGDAGGMAQVNPEVGWDKLRWTWDVRNHGGLVIEVWVHGEVGEALWLDELQLDIDTWQQGDMEWRTPALEGALVAKNSIELSQPGVMLNVYPNPFNPQTTVSYSMEQTEWASIGVYELSGRRVTLLANETFATGTHYLSWNGLDAQGRAMPSGTYLVRLEAKSGVVAKKISLIR